MSSILGISSFYHDSAATLLINGEIIAAAQEERFSRVKHDLSFPEKSINFVLDFANLKLSQVDKVVFYEKPFLKFERLLETYVAFAPKGFKSFSKAMPLWVKDKLFQKKMIIDELKKIDQSFNPEEKIFFSEHHLSHAASAYYPSPFNEAVILTADGVGEWATTTVALASGSNLEIKKELHFPHSLGLLYSAFTYYVGFKVNSGEYKLMGLAPYGIPKYVDIITNKLIDLKNDGTFKLDQSFFNYSTGLTMTNEKFNKLFGQKPRLHDQKIQQFHMDIAASIQKVTETVMIKLAKSIREEFNVPNLCLAGGVALNCVANGKIREEKIFDKIWTQPASGDAGGSLGAALALWYSDNKNKRISLQSDQMKGSYLGKEYSNIEIENILKDIGANFEFFEEQDLILNTINDLIEEKVIGWFQGRMEFGPRALGNRSILGDPRSHIMQKNLNLKIKYRESFRPFAPSILKENLSEWFNTSTESPYMLDVAEVKENHRSKMNDDEKKLFGIDLLNVKKSNIPAVTHVDFSSRIQTVDKQTNPRFHKLLSAFKDKTNCPILINTSFNVRGEPIVNTPEDAYNCFMGTEMDTLVIGNFYLTKNQQNKKLSKDYKNEFVLD